MDAALLIEPHFCPSLEYFCAWQDYSHVVLESKEHFVKQSYRNRCFVNTTQGVVLLSVPLTGKHGKVPLDAVRIDYATPWETRFWRTLESAYKNSPFFEHYAPDLNRILFSKRAFLWELNVELLSFCLENLKWKKNISSTSEYEIEAKSGFSDMRSIISTRNTYIERDFYRPHPYYQVFGNGFEENLSVLDLLFCTGPQAGHVLQASSFPRRNRLNK